MEPDDAHLSSSASPVFYFAGVEVLSQKFPEKRKTI